LVGVDVADVAYERVAPRPGDWDGVPCVDGRHVVVVVVVGVGAGLGEGYVGEVEARRERSESKWRC